MKYDRKIITDCLESVIGGKINNADWWEPRKEYHYWFHISNSNGLEKLLLWLKDIITVADFDITVYWHPKGVVYRMRVAEISFDTVACRLQQMNKYNEDNR